MSRKYLVLLLPLFLGLFLFTPQQSSALGNAVTISNSGNDALAPQTVTDSNGYLHAVWQELTPDQSWADVNPGIYYSRWNGDSWSTPLKISQNTAFTDDPALTVDSSGTVHVMWNDMTNSPSGAPQITYRSRSSSGIWSSSETLPQVTSTGQRSAHMAIDNTNTVNAVYTEYVAGSAPSNYWTKRVNGTWQTPQLISTNAAGDTLTDAYWSDLKSDATGQLHLIYWSVSQGIFYRQYTSGSWSTPINITTATDIDFTKLAVTSGGQAFVTWNQHNDTSLRVRWTVSGLWQNEQTMTTGATYSFWGYPIMGITTDSKGRAHVGWGEKDSSDNLIDLKYRSYSSGTWGASQDVDLNNNDADSPFIYPDKWDNQHFMWTEKNSTTNRWEIKYRVAEGSIQTIPTSGGTVTANPNSVTEATLSIPSGALSSSQDITIQVGPVPQNVDNTVVTLPKAYTFRPHGLTFLSPVTATIFYTDTEVAGADERALKPWFWNSLNNSWEAQTGKNTPSQNKIAVDLTHFSLYGISAPKVVTTFQIPQRNQIVKQGSLLYEFSLLYADGSPILPITSPDDLTVSLKDSAGQTVSVAKQDGKQLVKDTTKNTYKDVLHFQQTSIPAGTYTLSVYLAGNLVGEQPFVLSK